MTRRSVWLGINTGVHRVCADDGRADIMSGAQIALTALVALIVIFCGIVLWNLWRYR